MVHGLETMARLNSVEKPASQENPTVEHLRQTLVKHMKKEARVDKSADWNKGFDDCCKFFLKEIRIVGGKP